MDVAVLFKHPRAWCSAQQIKIQIILTSTIYQTVEKSKVSKKMQKAVDAKNGCRKECGSLHIYLIPV